MRSLCCLCVCACVSAYPPIVARQRLGEDPPKVASSICEKINLRLSTKVAQTK
jgi:hypothetical protein